jgi:hemerythrin-like domain-containing protein
MKATEILMEEHRVIERVLAALEAASNRLEAGQDVRPGFFFEAASFVKGFADGCHHMKEEGVLFPAMAEEGVPVQGGPIGVMLMEHEMGRAYIQGMLTAAERVQQGDASARSDLEENTRKYVALLKQHIQKEDAILFPMADQVIPSTQQDKVWDEFEHIEHVETGEGVHEKYLALADNLEAEVRTWSLPAAA